MKRSDEAWMNPPNHLRITIPFMPPTANKIYITHWRRKVRFLSDDAKAFKSKFAEEVTSNYLPWISQMQDAEMNPDVRYRVEALMYFDRWEVENKGWFSKKRSAQSRYKKMDTGNRLKLLLDCLATSLGVDDCHFFDVIGRKRIAQDHGREPGIDLFITRMVTG